MHTEEDRLLEALALDGTDALLKKVLADFYEETGRPHRAACMRWCAEHGRRPNYDEGADTHDWWLEGEGTRLNKEHAWVPPGAFRRLKADVWKSRRFAEYETPRRAWLALLEAWERTEGERAVGAAQAEGAEAAAP